MEDLKSTKMMWLKGVLFLLMGIASAALLLAEIPTLKAGVLLAVVIWAFCRAYYFAFYVIQHYVDPGFRFSGLMSFIGYVLRKK